MYPFLTVAMTILFLVSMYSTQMGYYRHAGFADGARWVKFPNPDRKAKLMIAGGLLGMLPFIVWITQVIVLY